VAVSSSGLAFGAPLDSSTWCSVPVKAKGGR
jgi:hypothetical protein